MTIPKLVAHRGYMQRYPENTLMGIKAALDCGACVIECDVQMNADQDFIVIHDDNFKRTAGLDQSVFLMTSNECEKISVHEASRFDDQFKPEFVPSLVNMLQLIQQYPEVTALVEIKEESLKYWGYERVMDKLLALLQEYQQQCILISFDDTAIEYAIENSNIRTGWVLKLYDQLHYHRATQLQADILICNHTKIPQGERPWQAFKNWMLYDIADPDLALEYGRLGVALIETADIKKMLDDPYLGKKRCSHADRL